MPSFFIRIVSLFIIPCLGMDPLLAGSLSYLPDPARRASPFQTTFVGQALASHPVEMYRGEGDQFSNLLGFRLLRHYQRADNLFSRGIPDSQDPPLGVRRVASPFARFRFTDERLITPVIHRLLDDGFVSIEEFLSMRNQLLEGPIDNYERYRDLIENPGNDHPSYKGVRFAVALDWLAFWSTLYSGAAVADRVRIDVRFHRPAELSKAKISKGSAWMSRKGARRYDLHFSRSPILDSQHARSDARHQRAPDFSWVEAPYCTEAFHAIEDLFRELVNLKDPVTDRIRDGRARGETRSVLRGLRPLVIEEMARGEASDHLINLMIFRNRIGETKPTRNLLTAHALADVISNTAERTIDTLFPKEGLNAPGARKWLLRMVQLNGLWRFEDDPKNVPSRGSYGDALERLIPGPDASSFRKALVDRWPFGARLLPIAEYYHALARPHDLIQRLIGDLRTLADLEVTLKESRPLLRRMRATIEAETYSTSEEQLLHAA